MPLVSVVIPVFKLKPDRNEIKSFEQCLKVLHRYPVSLVCPQSLDISFYKYIANGFKKQIVFERFSDKYFSGIEGYNQLMLSLKFYRRFKKFNYILLYQLDAWVFRDELEYWCRKGNDYIGAPWFEGWHEASPQSPLIGVGNGGFSLRRTISFIRLVKVMNYCVSAGGLLKKLKLFQVHGKYFLMTGFLNLYETIKPGSRNEDHQFFILSTQFKWFKVASCSEAMRFSFDVNPDVLYDLNNCLLPFGCHAWERYRPDFWSHFIA